MSDTPPPVPLGSTIRQNVDGTWSYRVGPHAWRPMPSSQTAAPWVSPVVASIPMERLDAQALAVQLEEDGKYLMASAMANECPKTRDLAVRVIRAAVLLAGAAALYAAAGQMIKTDDLTDTVEDVIRGAERHHQSGWLHTIATELEGVNG